MTVNREIWTREIGIQLKITEMSAFEIGDFDTNC